MKKAIRNFIGFVMVVFFRLFHRLPRYMNWYFHDPSPELFESLVKWGLKHGYSFIPLEECRAILSGEKPLAGRAVYISFDDGWKSNVELLPICEKYRVPITIFVTTRTMEEGNFWWEYADVKMVDEKSLKLLPFNEFEQKVKCLKEGVSLRRSAIDEKDLDMLSKHPLVSIQSHTVTHPILTNCPDDVLEFEVNESKKDLEEFIGKKIVAFSYPNGNVSARECHSVEKAGYSIAFTTQQRPVRVPEENMFLIPRMAFNTFGGKYENLAKAFGIFQNFVELFYKHFYC